MKFPLSIGSHVFRGGERYHSCMSTADRIITELKRPGLLDYHFLSRPTTLTSFSRCLTMLIGETERRYDAILAVHPDAATFENTVDAALKADDALALLWSFLQNLDNTDTSKVTRGLIRTFQPKLVALDHKVIVSERLYGLLRAVSKKKTLTAVQRRSLTLMMRGMEAEGVHRSPAVKKKLKTINTKLSHLSEKFTQNTVDDRKTFFHHITDASVLSGMPESDRQSAQAEATRRKLPGFIFTLSPPSYMAILRYCTDRSVRRLFYETETALASKGRHDNRPVVLEILRLRQEKAGLLGFDHFADYALQMRMARSVPDIQRITGPFARAAKRKAVKEMQELSAFANEQALQLWDVPFWREKMKRRKFAIDDGKLSEYFPLEQTLAGLFAIARRLFGIEMKKLSVPSYATDVRSYEVRRKGKVIGYYVLDLFARESKRTGAWAECLRNGLMSDGNSKSSRKEFSSNSSISSTSSNSLQSRLPIFINTTNFAKGSSGKPTLLKHMDVQTIFHEFGHALHGILSAQPYENLDGFHTEWDFVELPSQFLENWCWESASLDLFARHWKTKERLPRSMLSKMKRSRTFMAGFLATGYSELSDLDVRLHTIKPPRSVAALDRDTVKHARAFYPLPVPKTFRRYASFGHIFSGGYAAGYYSYLWAEVLEADIFSLFEKSGILSSFVGEKYRRMILAKGASEPGEKLFEALMGRKPSPKALMRKRGLV